MISRRSLLSASLLSFMGGAACRKSVPGFQGYAFIANQDGQALAALDLDVMAVSKHIPLQGSPTEVVSSQTRPVVYALTPDNGTIHEVSTETFRVTRQLQVAASQGSPTGETAQTQSMALSVDEKTLYVMAREARSLVAVSLENLKVAWRLRLPEEPLHFALNTVSNLAAISSGGNIRVIDLANQHLGDPLPQSSPTQTAMPDGSSKNTQQTWGQVRFLNSGDTLVAANLAARQLTLYRVESSTMGGLTRGQGRIITNLPIAVRPDNLCFNQDGGQLFVTGEGRDAVVVVYPYDTPRVAETVLAGHAPGVMGVSKSLLFVASPESGDVSILNIPTRKVIAVTQVGSDPGFITVTPDDEYALVLNRQSGDVAVIRVAAIQPNRYKSAALLTVIPVGSKPVSAALRAVS